MGILQIVIFCVILGIGIYIFIRSYRLSVDVYFGKVTSISKIVGISVLSGSLAGLLFISVVLLIAIQDTSYQWTITGVIVILIIALVLAIIGTLGSLWRFFITGKFRAHLFDKLKKKNSRSI